jgi:hypothetical protein
MNRTVSPLRPIAALLLSTVALVVVGGCQQAPAPAPTVVVDHHDSDRDAARQAADRQAAADRAAADQRAADQRNNHRPPPPPPPGPR